MTVVASLLIALLLTLFAMPGPAGAGVTVNLNVQARLDAELARHHVTLRQIQRMQDAENELHLSRVDTINKMHYSPTDKALAAKQKADALKEENQRHTDALADIASRKKLEHLRHLQADASIAASVSYTPGGKKEKTPPSIVVILPTPTPAPTPSTRHP